MMRKIIVTAAILASAVMVFAQRPGSVTSITWEGNEIILHPDSTWAYAKPSILSADENDDVFITMRDNRILWLKPDYTWTYTKTQPKANKPKTYPTLNAQGAGQGSSVDQSHKMAMNEVYKKAAATLRSLVPMMKHKKLDDYIIACLKDEIKEHEVLIDYKANNRVEAKINNIPPYRVKKIIECVEYNISPPAE